MKSSIYCGMRSALIFILACLLPGCEKKKSTPLSVDVRIGHTTLKYAEGFTVEYQGRNKLVEVKSPFQGATEGMKYLLVQKGGPITKHDQGVKVISIPLESIVCTSTTHIPLLDYLGESKKLVGFPSTDYISSEKVRARIEAGKVEDLGIDDAMNLERLAMLRPGMVMGYSLSGDYGQFKKIEELNIPVVVNAEYLEKHPLGRAEWIKFMALFFNKEQAADSIFNAIEKSYIETRSMADTARSGRPTVLSGIVYGDAWFLPGGRNYAATLLKDAGCHYLWEDDPSSGFLELSFESVYDRARDARLWIGVGNFSTLQELATADGRYGLFKAFLEKRVYTYDARRGAKGGSEYLESGYLRPDIILKDLVKIGHPELLPDYPLYFHKRLK